MRTRFEIVLADERDEGELRAAGEEALDEIERVEMDLSAYRRDAVLFGVNAFAADGPVQVDPVLFGFLSRAGALSQALGGAFDPTVGPLVRYHRAGGGDDPAALAAARAAVGFAAHVRLDPATSTVAFTRPGVMLDAGALGKGYALARAASILGDVGIDRALLHGGTSSVLALGPPPALPAWQVAVQHPSIPGDRLATVALLRSSLSVSSIFGRTTTRGGRSAGHVIDPRSGEPVAHTHLAAVVGADATDVEAISTALLVLGADEGLALVERAFPAVSALVATPTGEGDELRVDVVGDAFEAA
jgi:thiamine biosynthesis lipoprotein